MTTALSKPPARLAAPFEAKQPCHPERSRYEVQAESKDPVLWAQGTAQRDPSTSLRFAQDDSSTL
ncbi:hypothetical protein [Cyclonatronum proteinivorum]|uniref:hypothetical protein n=1 Tax=Cyclonatronum proteinivorum TaxID=1457365 RepID=UPI000F51D9BD|nr:hypothetical protein [Cyclonatronum proteinivorum]